MKSAFTVVAQWFRDRRIRAKVMIVYLPLLLLPLIILGYTANAVYSKAIIEKSASGFADNSMLIINSANGMLSNMDSCANLLSLNLNRAIAERYVQKNGTELSRYTAITTQLSLALLVFPNVESAVFIDTQGHAYGSHPILEQQPELGLSSQAYKDVMETNGINLWLPMEKRSYWVTDPESPVLTVGKKILEINTGNTLGVLFLNMKEHALSGVLSSMNAEASVQYFIADEKGNVVSSPDQAELLHPIADRQVRNWVNGQHNATEIRTIGSNDALLAVRDFPKLGWKLVSVAPLDQLTTGLGQLQLTILAIGGLCCLFAMLGAGTLSNWIAKPIVRLARSMQRFQEGHLDSRMVIESRDELGLFAAGFNEMTRRIKSLLENIKAEQRKKREYELALIQAQIKPHFLYNTLDVIYALSEMGRIKDVQRTTKALADFYRAALSKGKELVTIEQEIRNIRDYLAIQHIRYADVFTYTIEVEPEIYQEPILKLTIQPLIENAIYHVLKLKPDQGHLSVNGWREQDWIYLEVVDDGVGIPQEKLDTLLEPSESSPYEASAADGDGAPYGLRNVNDRMKLSFGDHCGLFIESEQGKGTRVVIRLPACERAQQDQGRHSQPSSLN